MATIRGTLENITSPPTDVFIFGLGWKLPAGYTESIIADVAVLQDLYQAEDELEALMAASKIEIRNSAGTLVIPGGVYAWLNDSSSSGIISPTHIVSFHISNCITSQGERWFQWVPNITHLEVPWPINSQFTILRVALGVDKIDSSNTYGIHMYSNTDLFTPVFETGVVLPLNSKSSGKDFPFAPTPQQFPGGDYLFSCYRVSGSGRSDFDKVMLTIYYLRQE